MSTSTSPTSACSSKRSFREREVEAVQRQRLLMPVLVELLPEQMVTFATIAEELERNGFEAEPFGPRTLAVKATPVGLEGRELERMLSEVLAVRDREQQAENAEARRTRIAASIACHAAIKINTLRSNPPKSIGCWPNLLKPSTRPAAPTVVPLRCGIL